MMDGIRINNLNGKVNILVDIQKIEAFKNLDFFEGSAYLEQLESMIKEIMLKIKSDDGNANKKMYMYINNGNMNICKYTLNKHDELERM